MKSSKSFVYMVICGFVCHFFVYQTAAYTQDSMGESIDCTDVTVDYADDLTLSREERLRLMDEAFLKSLNKFELCQSERKGAAAGGAAGGGEKGTTSTTGESVASSAMSGTETQADPPPDGSVEAGKSGTLQRSQDRDKVDKTGRGMAPSNGKPPEDIPSAENDDVLAAQIRYAAEKETDPVKKKRLWNEYRKYKGLEPEK